MRSLAALSITILAAPIFFASVTHGESISPSFLCSVKISKFSQKSKSEMGPSLYDKEEQKRLTIANLENHPVVLSEISESESTSQLAEVIPGLEQAMKKQMGAHTHLMLKAYWVNKGGMRVPELQLGVYVYNKFVTERLALLHSSSADARGYTSLNYKTTSGYPTWVEVTCRNVDYREA